MNRRLEKIILPILFYFPIFCATSNSSTNNFIKLQTIYQKIDESVHFQPKTASCIHIFIDSSQFGLLESKLQFTSFHNSNNQRQLQYISHSDENVSTTNLFVFKYSFPCGIVHYINPPYKEIQFKWLQNLPGSFLNSVHLLFVNKLPDIQLLHKTEGVRIMFNQIFITTTSSNSCGEMFTTDRNCKKFLKLGQICDVSGNYLQNQTPPILWNKWVPYGGKSYKFANANETKRAIKIDCKSLSDSLRKPFNTIHSHDLGDIVLNLILCAYGEGINATTIRNDRPAMSFDIMEYVPGSYTGLAYEVVLGRSQALFGLAYNLKHSKFLEFSVGFFDSYTFMTARPKIDKKGSIWFIFHSFDIFIWMFLLFSCILQVIVLTLFQSKCLKRRTIYNSNNSSLSTAINTILKPILDQPLENSILMMGQSWRMRFISGIWLLSTILIVNMFRSKLASSMVLPMTIQPPRNMFQLLNSDYKVYTYLYAETEFKEAMESLMDQGSKIATRLNKTFEKHFGGPNMHQCFPKILTGKVACMGFKEYGTVLADQVLVKENAFRPYIWAEDYFLSRPAGLAISRLWPHVKPAMDRRTGFMNENGVGDFWGKIFIAHKNTQENSTTILPKMEIQYPIYILLVGLLLSFIFWIFELLK